jgi:phage baseplate assembly protein W
MPDGLSPKLPMSLHPSDGYRLTKTYKEMVKQNMKMLILTAPGERMMDPLFGVGLRNFLFQPNHPKTWGTIEGRIKQQTKKYMPFVKVLDIDFGSQDDNPQFGSNTLSIKLRYKILPLDSVDGLDLYISGEDTGAVSMNTI